MLNLKQNALNSLIELSKKKGYLTNADILDASDQFDLEIAELSRLTSEVLVRGVILYEDEPDELDIEDYVDKAHLDYDTVYKELIEIDPIFLPLVKDLKKIIPAQTGEIEKLRNHLIEKNSHAKERLIEIHLRMAVRRAMVMAVEKGGDIHDTIGIAFLSLLDTAEKYDPTTSAKFSGNYGLKSMTDFKRNLPLKRKTIDVPAHIVDDYYLALSVIKPKGCIDCRKLEYCEKVIAIIQDAISGCSVEKARIVRECMIPELTIQQVTGDRGDQFSDHESTINSIDEALYSECVKKSLNDALDHLKEKERDIIIQRFGLNGNKPLTLEELGKQMGVTRERIRQIETKALKKLSNPAIKNRLIKATAIN